MDKNTENRLVGRPYYSYLFALNFLKDRLPENLELDLVSDPQVACLYAKNVIKGKLPDPVHNSLILQINKNNKEFVEEYLKYIGDKT